MPWPLPKGWLVTGLAHVGDDRTPGARWRWPAAVRRRWAGPATRSSSRRSPASGSARATPGSTPSTAARCPTTGRRTPDHRGGAPHRASGRCPARTPTGRSTSARPSAAGCGWCCGPETAGFLLVDEFKLNRPARRRSRARRAVRGAVAAARALTARRRRHRPTLGRCSSTSTPTPVPRTARHRRRDLVQQYVEKPNERRQGSPHRSEA